jgi:hypothetical protein
VPCGLDSQYIVMYVITASEAPLPQYVNCWIVSRSVLFQGLLVMCVSLGGTPFVFLVIAVLCIATSCVLQESSFTYILRDFCCLRCVLYLIIVVKLGCFTFHGG